MENSRFKNFKQFNESIQIINEAKDYLNRVSSKFGKIIKSELTSGSSSGSSILDILSSRGTLPSFLERKIRGFSDDLKSAGEGHDDIAPAVDDDEIERSLEKIDSEDLEARTKIATDLTETKSVERPNYNLLGGYRYDVSKKIRNYTYDDVIKILKDRGLDQEIENSKWNLVGLRNSLDIRRSYPNGFVDGIFLINPKNDEIFKFPASTFPGIAYRVKPYRAWYVRAGFTWLGNPPANRGLAILQEGAYRYKIGKHRGKDALLQDSKVEINRYDLVEKPDQAKSISTYSPGENQSGYFGILIHRASEDTARIDNWSAGCQLTKKSSDMDKIISKTRENGGKIKYILAQS